MKTKICWLMALVVVCTGTAWGQARRSTIQYNNSIEVVVRTRGGEDIRDLIRLELFRGDIPVEERYADSRGRYVFGGLEDGGYGVRVSAPGYRTDYRDVQLNGNVSRHVMFHLRRGNDEEWKEVSLDDYGTVSVRWLTFPEKARKQVSKARELRRSGDYEGAVKRLKNLLKVHPAFAIAQNELGLSYWRMNMLEQARKSLEAAIQNDPEYLIAYLNLAEVWMQEKEYNRAGQVLAQASKAQPDRGEPFYSIAKIQYETGHLDRAEQACRLALERDTSKIPEVHILLANVYLRRGEKAKLAAELETYLENAPEGEHAQDARATLEKIKRERGSLPKP